MTTIHEDCSLCRLNHQVDNGGRSSHPGWMLDCLKRWQSDHTCHHPYTSYRFSELATKSGMGSPYWHTSIHVSMFWHPPSNTHVEVLPWTCQNWREMTEQIGWQAKQPSQVVCILEDLKCWGAWGTYSGHKAKDITVFTPSTDWRKEAWTEEMLGDLAWKDCQSDERWKFQRVLGKRLRDGVDCILWAFLSAPILSWSELTI